MNDLTKEARARAYAEAMDRAQQMTNEALQNPGMSSAHYGNALGGLASYYGNALASARPNIDPSFGRPKYGNDYLEPDRPLTGRARNYLTRWDDGSRCDLIDVPRETVVDEMFSPSVVSRPDYMAAQKEKNTKLRSIVDNIRAESRTGINLDKINRVSDEYRKISDEVDNEIGE